MVIKFLAHNEGVNGASMAGHDARAAFRKVPCPGTLGNLSAENRGTSAHVREPDSHLPE